MSQKIFGDLEVLRSFLARRVDSGAVSVTGATTLDRHSQNKVLATAATAYDISLPVADLPIGWSTLVKNSGLSSAPVTLKVGSASLQEILPGSSILVFSLVEAPAAVTDWAVLILPNVNANNQLDLGGKKIINVASPSDGTDASNKAYVDGAIIASFSDKAGLGIIWNGTTNKFDIDLAANSGLEFNAEKLQLVKDFEAAFNATTDWGTAAGGYYTKTILASAHGQGTKCNVVTYLDEDGSFSQVFPDKISISATGDVSFRVPSAPDLRFPGKVVVVAVRT
jgi:hypothetical protein